MINNTIDLYKYDTLPISLLHNYHNYCYLYTSAYTTHLPSQILYIIVYSD